MGLTNFDELNTLSTTETTKDDRRKATRKKIPIHDYFENMQISEEERMCFFYLLYPEEIEIPGTCRRHFRKDTFHR